MAETESPTASPIAGDDAEALFAALGRLSRAGQISMRFDYKKLEQMDSPVGSEADGNIWAYGGIALALASWWFAGWQAASAVAVIGIAAYMTLGRAYHSPPHPAPGREPGARPARALAQAVEVRRRHAGDAGRRGLRRARG